MDWTKKPPTLEQRIDSLLSKFEQSQVMLGTKEDSDNGGHRVIKSTPGTQQALGTILLADGQGSFRASEAQGVMVPPLVGDTVVVDESELFEARASKNLSKQAEGGSPGLYSGQTPRELGKSEFISGEFISVAEDQKKEEDQGKEPTPRTETTWNLDARVELSFHRGRWYLKSQDFKKYHFKVPTSLAFHLLASSLRETPKKGELGVCWVDGLRKARTKAAKLIATVLAEYVTERILERYPIP